MADKSYSPIVHQNNQPVSAVANNDSVPPQYDTAAKTAASNTPPVADNGSTEANAEPATFNDDRENEIAEWLSKQDFESKEIIDKVKRKSDLDQLFKEIKALSEPAYQCTKVWRSLLMEIGQDYFDWFHQLMCWLLFLCQDFTAFHNNQASSSRTPSFQREYAKPLSQMFCTCALLACLQFFGSLIPTASPDKRAHLLSAFSCSELFESYIKKLKKATKSSLEGIDLQLFVRHLKAYDAMRFMGQHILAELGIKKEQFAGIGHRSVATRVNSGADIDNGIKSIDRHVKHRIKSEVLNQADNQLFDEREQALDAEYTKTFPPQAPKTPGGQASEIQLDHKSAVDIYQQQLHHKSTLAQIDPVTASKIDPVKEAELVAVTEQSATGVAPENITYVIVPTAQCLTEERQDELTGFSHGKTSTQAVNTLWVLKYNPATETAVLLPYGSGSAVMQPLKFQGGLPTRLFLEQRYDNVMEGKSIASCVRALLDQGFDLSPRTFTQNCHAFDTLLTDDAVGLFTRLHQLSNSTTQVDETFHVILSNGTLDTESSKEQIQGKGKDKGKGGSKQRRKQINRVHPMVIVSANSDDFPVAIFVVATSRSYESLHEVLKPVLEGSKTQVLVSDKYRPYIRIAKEHELENAFCHAHALRYNYNAVMASIEAMQKLLAKNIEDVKNANGYKEDSELTQSDRDLIESKLMEHIKSFSKEDKAMMVALACQSNLFKVNRLNADTWAKAKAKSQNYSNNGTLTSEERQAAIDEVMRRSEQYGRVFFELFVKILNNLKHSEKAATYKAANYVCNDVDAFSTCLKHGFVPMDNNSSESMMKQAAVVRKHQLANQDLDNLRSIFDDKTVFVTMLKLGYGKESILNLAERMSTLRFEHILSRQAELCYARDGHGENLQRDLWSLSLKSHSTTFTPWRYIVDFLKEERDRLRAQGQEIIALPADAVAIALQEEKQRVDQATADFKQYLADLKEQRLASQKSA